MRWILPPFTALKAFMAVVHHGSIRRAAEAMSRDHAVVSRHLKALEDWAGVTLLERGGNGATLTEAGAQFHARMSNAFDEIDGASRQLTGVEEDPLLHVWCIPGFATRWLSARLPQFRALHPEIDIELRPADRRPDLLRNEADADIRYILDTAEPPVGGLRAQEIARPTIVPVAAPDFARDLGPVETPLDLLKSRLLHEENFNEWTAWFAANDIDAKGRIHGPKLWHAHLSVSAATRGEGVAMANGFLVNDDLAAGKLVTVLPQTGCRKGISFGSYMFMAREERWQRPALVKFRTWLIAAARQEVMLNT